MDTKNQTIDTDGLYQIYLATFTNYQQNEIPTFAKADDSLEVNAVKAIVTGQMIRNGRGRFTIGPYSKTELLKQLARLEVIDMEFPEDPSDE